jgi:fibronectin type 3 domain-containing protein/regulation of enolase protein 1 (concanavalin A-like superfamily)
VKQRQATELLRRAINTPIENLEDRRMLSGVVPGNTQMVFSTIETGAAGGAPSASQTLTLTDSNTTALNISSIMVLNDPNSPTQDASAFTINTTGVPATLQPGESANVLVWFATSNTSIRSAVLQIQSNDTTTPTTNVALRGLGTAGYYDSLQPSLQRILDLYQIPVVTGDPTPNSAYFDGAPNTPNDEIVAQQFAKSGSGPVTITPLAVYDIGSPVAERIGFYTPGSPNDTTELFTISGATSASEQTVNPVALGATSFDPGSSTFGLYAQYPNFVTNGQERVSYSESALNTWDAANPQKMRAYPLKNPDGSVVPNAYVVAFDDYNVNNYFTTMVAIVKNIKPLAAGPVLGLEALGSEPSSTRLVFNRVQSASPPAADPSFTDVVDDTGTVRIHNTGRSPLVISSVTLSDTTNWQIVNPPAPGTIVAANGGALDITVKFIATTAPAVPYNETNDYATTTGLAVTQAGGVWNGTLTINANDPSTPAKIVQLAGYWQSVSEHEMEPGLQTVANLVFGYGTDISNTEQPEYPNNGAMPVYYGEEVASGLWDAADPSQAVSVVQLAGFSTQYDVDSGTFPTPAVGWYPQGGGVTWLFSHAPGNSQSVLPNLNGSNGTTASGSFNPTGAFGFDIDGEQSQDALNTADIALGRSGHAVRFFPVRDGSGKLIPNTWLMVMDYEASAYDNADFQDNVYLVKNMRPANQAPAPADLQAVTAANGIGLQWQPVSDSTLIGYNIYRSSSPTGPFTLVNSSPVIQASFSDNSISANSTEYYRVTAVDAAGESQATSASAVAPSLISLDLNSTPAGSTTVLTPGKSYIISGGGVDIGGSTIDGFRFVYQSFSGDFDAEVQVSSLTQTIQSGTRAGLMVKTNLDPSGQMVFSGATASDGYRFSYRDTADATGVYTKYGAVSYPNVWVRLVRQGNVFTGYISSDGVNWTQTGQLTLALPNTLLLGMAVCSHDVTQLATAQFAGYSAVAPTPSTVENLFGSSGPASANQNVNDPTVTTTGGVELGLKFQSTVAGYVTGVRFYKGSSNTGAHTGELWSSTGQLLATAIFSNETMAGWQTVTFSSPVAILANTTYIVSYHTTAPYLSYTPGAFASSGVTSGTLQALAAGVNGPNAVYHYDVTPGTSSFPNQANGQSPNYWVDVVFSTGAPVAPVAPSAPAALAASVSGSTVTLSWAASTGTVTAYHVERSTDGVTFTEIAGSVSTTSYVDTTASLNSTYTYRVRAENSGAYSGYSNTQQIMTAANLSVSIFASSSAPPAALQNINDPTIPTSGGVELGMKFESDMAGVITGVRFWKGSLNTGVHTGSLWSNTGQLLATVTFTNETASGWEQANFSTPVAIAANTPYIVSYHTTAAYIAYSPSTFATAGIDNAPLHALASGVDGANSVYKYGASSFPTLSNGQSPSYWVDVVFSASAPVAPGAPASLVATATSAGPVNLAWTASTGTVTAYHVERSTNGGAFAEIAGSVTTPSYTDSAVATGTTYTYRVRAEDSGAYSGYSNTQQVTTAAAVLATSIFSSTSAPAAGLQNVNDATIPTSGGVELGMKFQSSVAGTITGVRFWKGTLNTGVHTGSLWSSTGQLLATVTFTNETASGWQQALFSTPVAISANTTYIVSYHTTAAYIAYTPSALSGANITNDQLSALASGIAGANSVYSYGTSMFPTQSNGQSPSYWVDVVFAP